MPPTTKEDELSSVEPESVSERMNQADIAYSRLKKLILDGTLPAGAQMLEQEAAERLDMSRTPVREAMVRLRQDGMVEIRPRHGMRVLPVSARDMADIYEVLTALEGTAAEAVARRGLSARPLNALRGAVTDMGKALEAGDLAAWAEADERFHSQLVQMSGNTRLIQMVGQLWDQAHRARMLTLKLRPTPTNSVAEHAALVDAIASGDPAAARQIHEDHRRRAGTMLVELLERLGLSQL
ncbi:GntR family transcriptional regulator [Devosia yakushimensis]|uniref:GntR family transcriptional regulator n=1 Tax=Devosia yakushimensis TaxID=470028 RepID=A0ABQ5UIT5_9HYPH|nr:GntR family transcriptional regulator [Devosia yakushimensis]GLQ10526.1 GntR family transcriptional regulator [Devosia yakushimensis]